MKHESPLKALKQEIYLSVKDYLVSGERFSLLKNDALGILETHPQPTPDTIHKYYKSEAYISHTDSKKGLLDFLYQTIKRYSLGKKVALIEQMHGSQGSILDIGAGTGEFLMTAAKRGWDIRGVEINIDARRLAKEKNILLYDSMAAVKEKQFDVVTLWHVLEHLHDLPGSITQITKFVKPGGTLVVAVPNYNSYDADYYGSFWAAYDVPRHLWHFSQVAMQKLFAPELSLKKIKPLIFDAFYVSLLSEKYATGKKFSLKAFWIGLRSNLKARRTTEYSSLIYVYHRPKKP